MEETPTYDTERTPTVYTVAWPEFNDVMQFLGVTVEYPGKRRVAMHYELVLEEEMLKAAVTVTDDALYMLMAGVKHRYEFKMCSRQEYEYYMNVLESWATKL